VVDAETAAVVTRLTDLLDEHYVDRDAVSAIVLAVRGGLASGRYGSDLDALASAVSTDLQSVNGDLHLRLLHHTDELPDAAPGDDSDEYESMARWAASTGDGVARVERLPGNVGLLVVDPILFPVTISGTAITAAMSLVASADALILDLRHCLGGDPAMVAWLCSYLFGRDPVELAGLRERGGLTQSWTLPHVPGTRFGADKPVFVLTSTVTFSGGEQLSYDLQRLGRATVVGEQTRGGAHAREGFRVHPHLEATIPVAAAVDPVTGDNWEQIGVTPDVVVTAEDALDRALRLAVR
jgi:hypothetical protein